LLNACAFSTVREVRPRLLKCGRIGSSAMDNSPLPAAITTLGLMDTDSASPAMHSLSSLQVKGMFNIGTASTVRTGVPNCGPVWLA
jgi:hypothetical protein